MMALNTLILLAVAGALFMAVVAVAVFLVLQFSGSRRPRADWVKPAFWVHLALFILAIPGLFILGFTLGVMWVPLFLIPWGLVLVAHAALSWTSKAAPEDIFL